MQTSAWSKSTNRRVHYKHLEKLLPICCNGSGRKGRNTNNPCWSASTVHSQTGSCSHMSPVHTCLPFPPDWSLGSAHVRNRNFFSATLPSSSVPEIPKLSCKMATLICKQITWSTAFPLRSKESALRFLHSAAAREQPVKELFIKFILTLSNEIWGNYIKTTEHQSCSKYMSLLC